MKNIAGCENLNIRIGTLETEFKHVKESVTSTAREIEGGLLDLSQAVEEGLSFKLQDASLSIKQNEETDTEDSHNPRETESPMMQPFAIPTGFRSARPSTPPSAVNPNPNPNFKVITPAFPFHFPSDQTRSNAFHFSASHGGPVRKCGQFIEH